MDAVQIILSLLAGGGITGLLNYFTNRRRGKAYSVLSHATAEKRIAEASKLKVEAEVTIAKEWMKMAHELQSQIDELKKTLENERRECDRSIAALKSEVDNLKKQRA